MRLTAEVAASAVRLSAVLLVWACAVLWSGAVLVLGVQLATPWGWLSAGQVSELQTLLLGGATAALLIGFLAAAGRAERQPRS